MLNIGNDLAVAAQILGNSQTFATGRGTDISNALSRLNTQSGTGKLRSLILIIVTDFFIHFK